MRLRGPFAGLLLLLAWLGAGCRDQQRAAATDPTSSPSGPPTVSIPTGPASPISLAAASHGAPLGRRVAVEGYLWLRKPECPPCPPGADCEPCPPPFHQFAERPLGSPPGTSLPGAILLVELRSDPGGLTTTDRYRLEGVLSRTSDGVVLHCDLIVRATAR